MRERGGWIGLAVGTTGLVLAILVLGRGGTYFRVVHDLQWSVPMAVVGLVTALAAGRLGEGRANSVVWLLAAVVGAIGWNVLVYSYRLGRGVFDVLVPTRHPTGLDFRDGLYLPGKAFSNAASGWPPFTLWVGRAFASIGFSAGYAIQVCLLLGFAAGTAVLCAFLARGAVPLGGPPSAEGDGAARPPVEARQLGLLGGLWLFTSYGFMYEVERGQIDLYALFFTVLAVWLLVRRPEGSPWWPSLALALAVNFKAYPAVLAVVLLWRYRWRGVVPLLVANVVLFIAAGPVNVRRFIVSQTGFEKATWPLWWGNDSAASLGHTLHQLNPSWPSWLGVALLLLSAIVWVATLVVVMRRGWNIRGAVLASAACVPVMCTFPSISHDYKLVLLVFPLVVLAAVTAAARGGGGPLWAVLFMAVAAEFFLLARSSLVVAPSLQGSKFALIVGVQVLLLVVAMREVGAVAGTSGREHRPTEAQA
jgi:hypothetical protein